MTNESNAQDQRTDTGVVVRQARLRATYAKYYPAITPEVWMPAAEVGAVVLFRSLVEHGRVFCGDRLLDEHHFEFRGGWTRGDQPYRTRAVDVDENDFTH